MPDDTTADTVDLAWMTLTGSGPKSPAERAVAVAYAASWGRQASDATRWVQQWWFKVAARVASDAGFAKVVDALHAQDPTGDTVSAWCRLIVDGGWK